MPILKQQANNLEASLPLNALSTSLVRNKCRVLQLVVLQSSYKARRFPTEHRQRILRSNEVQGQIQRYFEIH